MTVHVRADTSGPACKLLVAYYAEGVVSQHQIVDVGARIERHIYGDHGLLIREATDIEIATYSQSK